MGGNEGPPGAEPRSDRKNLLALDGACAPLLSANTPEVTEQQMIPQQEEVMEREGAPEIVSGDTMEAGGQQPMSSDPSSEVPDSPPITIRSPSSPVALRKKLRPLTRSHYGFGAFGSPVV